MTRSTLKGKAPRFVIVPLVVAGLAALACGGGGSNETSTETPPTAPSTGLPVPLPVAQCDAVRTAADRAARSLDDRSAGLNERIVGGETARAKDWPWAVALTYQTQAGTQFQYCGGSLIDEDWVLTAAHCEVEVTDTVLLGRHDLTTSAGETQAIEFVLTHLNYNDTANNNDIALIKLVSASGQEAVALIDAADTNSQPGDLSTVVGWGLLAEGGSASPTLQQVEVPIVGNPDCANTYSNLTDNMICAGEEMGQEDSCQGDSGGPLMVRASAQAPWRQTGVVSFGRGCARADTPGVYTRVSKYLDWIDACMSNPAS